MTEMSEDEIAAVNDLAESNKRRIANLALQGVAINGLNEQLQQRVLEYLCGDALPSIRKEHELFVAEKLDEIDKDFARRKLTGGIGWQFPGGIGH